MLELDETGACLELVSRDALRFGQCPEDARADALHDSLDDGAFARSVPSFENDRNAGFGRLEPVLFDELILQLEEFASYLSLLFSSP
jgi:hypothetical protein